MVRELLLQSGLDPPVLVDPDAQVSSAARVGPWVSMEAGCVLEPNSTVESAILWEDVRLKAG
ncbi:hypothetical protein ACFL2Q_15390, partial [Thermodesulfobacteriota bacterium]